MVQLVCLANSWKHGDRCIAGIDLKTGQWIRPVSNLVDGRIPTQIRLIDGKEPALLDILDIPLEKNGPDFGFAIENRTLASGVWQKAGQVKATDLLLYCEPHSPILYNRYPCVTVPFLKAHPRHERRSLELVHVKQLSVKQKPRRSGGMRWIGTLIPVMGERLEDIPITDPVWVSKLEAGYRPQNPLLVTLSLSMPHSPSGNSAEEVCWKLIAGMIEFSHEEMILIEMHRLGWSVVQGRAHLLQTYRKRSRQQLTESELQEFLSYLQSLA